MRLLSYILIISLSLLVISKVVASEKTTDGAQKTERLEVTGSRLRRIDSELAIPVISLSEEDFLRSGDFNVGDFLRSLPQNSFGSFGERSGIGIRSHAQVDLRGLGANRTLILINGHRMAGSPIVGGQTQSVHLIPMSAVERIDVLADGASAIYGADAIGGVINVILKRDFEGIEVGGEISAPDIGGSHQKAHVIAGRVSDRYRIMLGAEYENRARIRHSDLDFAPFSLSRFSAPGTFRRKDVFGDGTNVIGPNEAAPTCSDNLLPDGLPQKRVSGVVLVENPVTGEVRLIEQSECLTNRVAKTDLHPDNERLSAFLSAELLLADWTVFTEQRFSWHETSDAGFPTTTTLSNITLPSGPLAGELIDINYSFEFLGPRFGVQTSYDLDSVLGVKTDWQTNQLIGDFEVSARFNRYDVDDELHNVIRREPFFAAIESGTFDPFNPTAADPSVIDSFRHVREQDSYVIQYGAHLLTRAEFRRASESAAITPNWIQDVGFAFGMEIRREKLNHGFDTISETESVIGSFGQSAKAARTITAAFVEWGATFFDDISLTLATRYDHYSDFGDAFSPKLTALWRATDAFSLRGTVGRGFRAPNLQQLRGEAGGFSPALTDRVGCLNAGIPQADCNKTRVFVESLANPELDAEFADQVTLGGIWSPVDAHVLSVDYYWVELTDRARLNAQEILDIEFARATGADIAFPPGGGVERNDAGEIIRVSTPVTNQDTVRTSGIDARWQGRFPTDGFGTFFTDVLASYVIYFKEADLSNLDNLQDQIGGPGKPRLKANASLRWQFNDHTLTWQTDYTDSTHSKRIIDESGTPRFSGRVEPWIIHHATYQYEMPWQGRLRLGIRNLFNEPPPLNRDSFYPFFDQNNYNAYGRTIFLSYTQLFN